MSASQALGRIPDSLRIPLLEEYESIIRNYAEHRWSPAELSGGRFCEIVYSILEGHATGTYPPKPTKPSDFVGACRKLEKNTYVPRSFRILIPRLLPAIYEVRNNRGVGHVGGDVDSNFMDATFVVAGCNWIMAELVRVYHQVSVAEAQTIVDKLVERRIPLIWEGGDMRRVLDPSLKLRQQILLLLSTSSKEVNVTDLLNWTGYKDRKYFLKTLRNMHDKRFIEFDDKGDCVHILPPGSKEASDIVSKKRSLF